MISVVLIFLENCDISTFRVAVFVCVREFVYVWSVLLCVFVFCLVLCVLCCACVCVCCVCVCVCVRVGG